MADTAPKTVSIWRSDRFRKYMPLLGTDERLNQPPMNADERR
jgi:hypothetical protein